MPVGPEKLCDDVLREHALVDLDAFQEDVPVQVASGLFRVGQGERSEKPCIGGVAFDRRMVLANAQAHARISGIETVVGNERIGKPEEGVLVIAGFRFLSQRCDVELLLLLGKLTHQVVEDARDAYPVAAAMLGDVLPVQSEDVPFDVVDFTEIMGLDVFRHSLGHASDQHVFTEQPHGLPVQRIGERPALLERVRDERGQWLFSQSPEEFIEIHGIQADRLLL